MFTPNDDLTVSFLTLGTVWVADYGQDDAAAMARALARLYRGDFS